MAANTSFAAVAFKAVFAVRASRAISAFNAFSAFKAVITDNAVSAASAISAVIAVSAVMAVRTVVAVRTVGAVRAVIAVSQCRTILFRKFFSFPRIIVFVIPATIFINVIHTHKILNFGGIVKDYSSLFLMARFAADKGLTPSSYHCI